MKSTSTKSARALASRHVGMSLCLFTLILLPQLFAQTGGQHYTVTEKGSVIYTVQKGETFGSVAAQFDMTVRDLKRQLDQPFEPGKQIVFDPPGAQESNNTLLSKYVESYVVQKADVQKADILEHIAQKFRKDKKTPISVEELAGFNALERREHEVLREEKLSNIARRYKVDVKKLREWNELPEGVEPHPGRLILVGWEPPEVGEYLYVPNLYRMVEDVEKEVKVIKDIEKNVKYEVYEVQPGDTIESIVEDLNREIRRQDPNLPGVSVRDLREINGLTERDRVNPGQPLLLPKPQNPAKQIAALPGSLLQPRPPIPTYHAVANTDLEVRVPGSPTRIIPKNQIKKIHIIGSPDSRGAQMVRIFVGRNQYDTVAPPGSVQQNAAVYNADPPTSTAGKVLTIAHAYMGVPYALPPDFRRTIDCSGLVMKSFVGAGVWSADGAPRTCRDQVLKGNDVWRKDKGQPLDLSVMRPGDRLIFDSDRLGTGPPLSRTVDHTAIYMGGGWFIHASPPHVRRQHFSARGGYYGNILAAVKREPPIEKELQSRGQPSGTSPWGQAPRADLFGMLVEPFGSVPGLKEQG